jgi:hypothetical protein
VNLKYELLHLCHRFRLLNLNRYHLLHLHRHRRLHLKNYFLFLNLFRLRYLEVEKLVGYYLLRLHFLDRRPSLFRLRLNRRLHLYLCPRHRLGHRLLM